MPNATLTITSAKGSTSGERENRRSASAAPAATYATRKLTTHKPNNDALWIITGAESWLYAHDPNVPCGESEADSHSNPVQSAGKTSVAASMGSRRAAKRVASTISVNATAGASAATSTTAPTAPKYGQSIPSAPIAYPPSEAPATRRHDAWPSASQSRGTGAIHASGRAFGVPRA